MGGLQVRKTIIKDLKNTMEKYGIYHLSTNRRTLNTRLNSKRCFKLVSQEYLGAFLLYHIRENTEEQVELTAEQAEHLKRIL